MRLLLCYALQIASLVLLGWVILSWIRVPYDHPIGRLHQALDKVVLPVVTPLRRVIPPINLGGIALDVSVIVLFIVLNIVAGRIC